MIFEPLYTAEEMRRAEEGHDIQELMRRAGAAVASEALRRFPDARSFVAVCGGGANGGDGRIAVERLRAEGREAQAVEVPAGSLPPADVLVDALFGTGFSGEPREAAASMIDAINGSGAPILAVDLPSGVDASTGEVGGAAVRADVTVTFHGPKVGLVIGPGRYHAGAVVVADIGLAPAETEHRLVTAEILKLVPRRRPTDNKYSAGSVLVVGGAPGLTGAVCLAAEAAFRADAGYVAVAVPAPSLPVVEARLLEAVKGDVADVFDLAERASALALGPGLGRGPEQRRLVRGLLASTGLPAVVDADALDGFEPVQREAPTVLTPHAGELGRLLDEDSDWVSAHRLEAARRCAREFDAVCLLKGADTIIAGPDGRALVYADGPPGLATAGTGDVLTGVTAAFLAKGMPALEAAAVGAAACGTAASLAPQQAGLVASDVIRLLPRALA
ncbi:MAG: NAD(P)H-hydrate dehydratase [Gaiellaceae bacterium]